MHPSATIHPIKLAILDLESKTKWRRRSDPPPPVPPLPKNISSAPPTMEGFEYQFGYEFWLCGHITRIEDGEIMAENGNLDHLPKHLLPRDSILKRLGDVCPRCYTQRVLQRLQGIKLLLFDCNTDHDAIRMAERRVTAVTEYLLRGSGTRALAEEGGMMNYPVEFEAMMYHVSKLGTEAYTAAHDDFAAVDRCLESRVSGQFVNRIDLIRDNALLYFAMSRNPVVRECMAQIVNETADMIRQIEAYEREEQLLSFELNAKVTALRGLLHDYLESDERHFEALGTPRS